MPHNYSWTATDRFGQKVIKVVEAETAQEAQNKLLADGYSNLALKEDEIMEAGRAGFSTTPKFLGEEIKVSAEDRLRHLDNPTVTFWDVLKKGIGPNALPVVLVILLVTYRCYCESYLSATILAGALILWLLFVLCMGMPSVYYRKLIYAADWNRWGEVMSLVATLKMIGRISVVKVPATELTRYRAQALIGMGKLQEGLAEFQPCEGRPDCPGWLYKQFVAGLYTLAKQYDKAIEYNLAVIAEKPTPTVWWDMAYRYARYKRDPVKARQALLEAEKGPIADFAKGFCARCRGVILYLEGDYAKAKTEFETAIDFVEKKKWIPFKDATLSISRAYLCCVLAKQRDFPAAKKNFEMAKEYLIATKEDKLIDECRQLIGSFHYFTPPA